MNKLNFTNIVKVLLVLFTFHFSLLSSSAQGWPENYGGVMLQGFYWDSFKDTRWVLLEQQANDLAASFDLIWIPQSGNCGSQSMGYDDLWWFPEENAFNNQVTKGWLNRGLFDNHTGKALPALREFGKYK